MTNTNRNVKLPLVEDFRLALMTQQFHLVFQPKVCARTNQIVGAEVLLRWQHPAYGLIPADHWVSCVDGTVGIALEVNMVPPTPKTGIWGPPGTIL